MLCTGVSTQTLSLANASLLIFYLLLHSVSTQTLSLANGDAMFFAGYAREFQHKHCH
ncbi:hypothetical protein IO421_001782 [Campylobacter fetus]|nr:hypothetical protein [Campylobacter fetus]EGK8154114.1 hypothetical protein [Campylobacter fetus]EGK8179865.1 hypothetical protein [Campylobacter fetus]